MGEVVSIKSAKPHIVINCGSCISVICIDDIRRLANGEYSLSEFDSPDVLAQALAVMALEFLE